MYSIAVQSDGKILIGGVFTTYAGTTRQRVARLNIDGSLDTSFDSSSGASSIVSLIAVQSDGKILIGGGFNTYAGTTRRYVARLKSDGSLDTTFDSSSGANIYLYSIAVQSDGKILIGGGFTTYAGTTRQYIARLTEDINSNAYRYFQYRTIFTTADGYVTPYLTQVQLDYTLDAPTMDKLMRHGKWFDSQGVKRDYWWAQ